MSNGLFGVDHGYSTTVLAEAPHCALAADASSTSHTQFWDLRTGGTKDRKCVILVSVSTLEVHIRTCGE